jgi:predicted RND superfamily exporter protein
MSTDPPFHDPTRSLWGVGRRIAASALLLVGGLSFLLLYLAFVAERFAWYQNLAVVLSVLMLLPTVLALIWISWGLAIGRSWADG